MAVGFTPKHEEDFPLGDLTREQFLVLAVEAANQLKWEIYHLSEAGLIAGAKLSWASWGAEVSIKTNDTTAHLVSKSTGSEIADWGKNKKNLQQFLATIQELETTITKEELAQKYELLKTHFVTPDQDVLVLPPPTTGQKAKSFAAFFIPVNGFFVTPILIGINILVFILMVVNGVSIMSPDSESLLAWGANFRPMTLDGQWWRLITNCFVHIGILHLLLNMYALMYIGSLLEPYLGTLKYLLAYVLTGIVASMASLWWHDLTVSAGASGAIFGMYGVFLAMLTTNLIEKNQRKDLFTSIAVFVGFNLLYGTRGGIDNAAHIGGLLSGMLIGYAYIPGLKKPETKKLQYVTMAALTVLVLVTSFIVYRQLPNDILKFDNKIKEVAALEQKALDIYTTLDQSPKEQQLAAIKDKGIPAWKEGIALLEETGKLDIPKAIQERNTKLKKYFESWLSSYELLYKKIAEDTSQYDEELASINKQIEAIQKELKQGQQGN